MSGGGHIIIDDAVKSIRNTLKIALTNPLVSGQLQPEQKATLAPILAESVDSWTTSDDEAVRKVFDWAVRNITT